MIGILLALSAYGQSNLPPCPKVDYSIKTDYERFAKWHNCWGRYKFEFLEGFKGDVLEGEWRNGNLNGQGTHYFLANNQFRGDKYVGGVKDGKKSGQGTYTYANGGKYVGDWKDDKYDGQGTDILANGNKYVGEWKGNKKDGRGAYTFADGRVKEGIWADDDFVRAEKINLPNQQTDLALNEERRRLEADRQALNSNLSLCSDSVQIQEWHMCRYKEDLGGGLAIDHEYRNGVPYFPSARQPLRGAFALIDAFGSSQELVEGPMDLRGVGVYIDMLGLNVSGARRVFGVLFDFPHAYPMSKRTSMRSFRIEVAVDCSSQKIVPGDVSGFYGSMGQAGPIHIGATFGHEAFTASELQQKSGLQGVFLQEIVGVVKNVLDGVCSPDIATRVNNAREAEKRQREQVEKSNQAQADNKPSQTSDTRRRLALVIGNDSYRSLPVLSNAVNDSKAMSEALKQANFEVSYYKNLSKREMEEALNNFSKKLGKDDVGMFYFAGHGIQADSRNFLIPVSENVKKSSDVPFEGVDVDRVMASLRDSRNSLNIVVLDACRNSLDTRGGMSRGLTVTDAPQGSIVAYATSPGKTASDGDSGNSPFTKNLIRVMQRKGLKIEDVFKEVRVAVSRETNGEQVPQELSQLVSDFYFRQ